MSAYAYLCLSPQGREVEGSMEAPDETAARRQLKAMGMKLLRLHAATEKTGVLQHISKAWRWISGFRSIGGGNRVMFYRQMQLMLKAGHTLLEALNACARLTQSQRLSDTLERIAGRIQRGSSLSAACAQEKEVFNRLAQKLLEAGELSGELGMVFERLATLLERRAEVRRQLISALVYPCFVLVFAIGVVIFLVIGVIPRFATFLNGRGRAMPWKAEVMLAVADWLERWGVMIGVVILVIAIAIPILRRIPSSRRVVDRLSLSLPIIGRTLTTAAMAQACWTFGLLVKSRLTVLEALRVCAQVSGNTAFAEAFSGAAEQVLAGQSLTAALNHPVLPLLMRHMAAVGEKSGQVDAVMESLGTHYQKELDARVKFMASMIEPVLIVVIGGLVGFVYLAFFESLLAVSTGV
ncbi:MAG: type II secretion system F family protein [Zoogloeaceae bacterium]|jgi:type IV pilus assembly protein PilC|nr:type II secretion system F family protein [Zoogloeaceae bacterium]